jgi:hypothetical protein
MGGSRNFGDGEIIDRHEWILELRKSSKRTIQKYQKPSVHWSNESPWRR